MEYSMTDRNFVRLDFKDTCDSKCSLQESSNIDPCLWIGVDFDSNGEKSTRAHLSQRQVAQLLPFLAFFVAHGSLPQDDN